MYLHDTLKISTYHMIPDCIKCEAGHVSTQIPNEFPGGIKTRDSRLKRSS